jgi:hypothetical protein
VKQQLINDAVSIWKQGPKPVIAGEYHDHWYNRLSSSFLKSFADCNYAAMMESILQRKLKTELETLFPKVPEWEACGHFVENYVFMGEKGKLEMFVKYKNNFCTIAGLKKVPAQYIKNKDYANAVSYVHRILKEKQIMAFIKHPDATYHEIIEFEIDGVPFKCEIDCLNLVKGYELDFKTSRDINSETYNKKTRKYESFIKANGYTRQRAIYRHAIYSKHEVDVLPMIAAVSKEEFPDAALYEFRRKDLLDAVLQDVADSLPAILEVLEGKKKPMQCGVCDFCKHDNEITGVRVVPDSDY